MARAKIYSAALDPTLISPLYHAAKCHGVPMTKLASTFVRDGLARMSQPERDESVIIREEPSARDPERTD